MKTLSSGKKRPNDNIVDASFQVHIDDAFVASVNETHTILQLFPTSQHALRDTTNPGYFDIQHFLLNATPHLPLPPRTCFLPQNARPCSLHTHHTSTPMLHCGPTPQRWPPPMTSILQTPLIRVTLLMTIYPLQLKMIQLSTNHTISPTTIPMPIPMLATTDRSTLLPRMRTPFLIPPIPSTPLILLIPALLHPMSTPSLIPPIPLIPLIPTLQQMMPTTQPTIYITPCPQQRKQ